MAPAPSKLLERTRFRALFLSSPTKKHKHVAKDPSESSDISNIEQVNPKYIIVAATNSECTLTEYNCFGVYKALKLISQNIITISNLANGNLLILVQSLEDAFVFINTTELQGICSIECQLHPYLNSVRGNIYAPFLIDIPEADIIKELSDQKVTSIFKYHHNAANDGVLKPNGRMLVTFELCQLPAKLDIGWYSVNVYEYIPKPMRCKSCQILGHAQQYCNSPPACESCGLTPHYGFCAPKCVNCFESHAASNKFCKAFMEYKEILKIKSNRKCTWSAATNFFKALMPKSSNRKKMTDIVMMQRSEDDAQAQHKQKLTREVETMEESVAISSFEDSLSIICNTLSSCSSQCATSPSVVAAAGYHSTTTNPFAERSNTRRLSNSRTPLYGTSLASPEELDYLLMRYGTFH